MLRPTIDRAICPNCEQAGIHATVDDCLTALRKAKDGSPMPVLRRDALDRTPPARVAVRRVRPDLARPDAEWLTIQQACAVLQITRRTLYAWMDADKVEWRYTAGGARRIRAASLWRSS